MQKRLLGLAWAVLLTAAIGCNTAELNAPGSSGGGSGGPVDSAPDAEAPPLAGRDPGAAFDGGVIPTSTNVTIQIEPSDLGAQVEASIRAAKTSVHMTMYLLTDTGIIDALGDLKAAGKDVKVVLNKTFPPDGGDNTTSFNQLKARGVDVVYAPSAYTFTHAKSVIIDNKTVLVMTMNLTYSSPKDNREYIATDADPADVADAETIFAADYAGGGVTVNGKLVVSPQTATPVSPRARLKALIDSSKTSLDVEVQSLSDDALTDAIILAHQDKVAVRVVLANAFDGSPGQQDSIAKLKAAGVPLKGVANPYIHAKAIVVDGAMVFVGSQNFTPTALLNNREIGLVTNAPAEAAKVRDMIAKDFGIGTPF